MCCCMLRPPTACRCASRCAASSRGTISLALRRPLHGRRCWTFHCLRHLCIVPPARSNRKILNAAHEPDIVAQTLYSTIVWALGIDRHTHQASHCLQGNHSASAMAEMRRTCFPGWPQLQSSGPSSGCGSYLHLQHFLAPLHRPKAPGSPLSADPAPVHPAASKPLSSLCYRIRTYHSHIPFPQEKLKAICMTSHSRPQALSAHHCARSTLRPTPKATSQRS